MYVLLLSVAIVAAQDYYSVPPGDAPQLAAWGKYEIGVKTIDLVHKDQVDILKYDPQTRQAPKTDRGLKVELWYPAVIPAFKRAHTVYEAPGRANGTTILFPGKALRDAEPLQEEIKYPLIVVSHGYPGSRTFLSYLGENLASKGYIVAAIDHTDSVLGDIKPFPSTLLNRSADQLFVIDELSTMDAVDPSKVAIVGYSMGGYGALTSAGARFGNNAAPLKMVQGGYLTDHEPSIKVKAIVAIAPWGMQPPIETWDAGGLKGIKVPSLFIVGDQDDVSGYEMGVRRAFAGASNSERCLLVYENARHNVGGNPRPPAMVLDSASREFFDEPVWRKDRITAINQHFISAFLDLYLKGDESKRSFLKVAPKRAVDGLWPLKPGESAGGKFSEGDGYWKGFQRRWAVGLQMECLAP